MEVALKLPKRKEYTVWVGFVDGKPKWWTVSDDYGDYGDCRKLDVYRTKREAKIRYEDVRKMKLVEIE